jgi:S-formylglutathione hydrolase
MAAMMQETVKKYFKGFQHRKFHESKACGCKMSVGVYLPEAYERSASPIPLLYFLSGLTCTDENASQKGGMQRYADENGIAVIFPDTSPRGLNVEGESDNWDFGVGAGMYLNATEAKWKKWRMYEYITEELPAYLKETFPNLDTSNASLMGHSMGGHGALTIFFKNYTKYKSVSAFSPICNPINCPWGQKAFAGYLGTNEDSWKDYDATELAKAYKGPKVEVFIDQGTDDSFLREQLKPENFKSAVEGKSNIDLKLEYRDGYDHSYFYIATFAEEHIRFHAKYLNNTTQ